MILWYYSFQWKVWIVLIFLIWWSPGGEIWMIQIDNSVWMQFLGPASWEEICPRLLMVAIWFSNVNISRTQLKLYHFPGFNSIKIILNNGTITAQFSLQLFWKSHFFKRKAHRIDLHISITNIRHNFWAIFNKLHH